MHKELLKIRLKMKYSIRGFSELLGYKPATYQCYEQGTRTMPLEVLESARAALKRDKTFFSKELPSRIDAVPKFMGEAHG